MQNFEITEDGTVCLWVVRCLPGGGHTSDCYELYTDEDGKLKAKKPEEE